MSEMIKRATAAVSKALDDHWDISLREFVEGYEEACARAVIEAMREPTEAMIEAGMDADCREWRRNLGDRLPTVEECQANDWRAMIDAALKTD